MKLTVAGQANDDPANGDIERALEQNHEAGWRIHLNTNGDDYIEAVADATGGYRISFVDQGERFNSEGPVDAKALKAVLIDYLNDGDDWRDACAFIPEHPENADSKARARISSEPPPWAIILVAGAFFATPLLFAILESRHLPSGIGIVWLVAGPMTVMGLAMLANKLLLARRTATWPQAAGRVTKSEVAASHHQKSGEATDVINAPLVEYEFSAKGQKFFYQIIFELQVLDSNSGR